MGIRVEAPKQDGNARFNTLKVNLQENNSAPRAVVADTEGNFYYGSAVPGGNVFPYTGSAIISGSLTVYGPLVAPDGITGSLFGTASWANRSISSSYALTSSLPLLGIVTASAVNTLITFTKGDGSTFDILIAQSGSVESASYAMYADSAGSASYAISASYALSASQAISSSYSISSSYALTSSYAVSASYSVSSSYSISSSYSLSSSFAVSSSRAVSASYALSASNAQTASFVTSSNVFGPFGANSILSASFAVSSSLAVSSSYALSSSYSVSSSYAQSSSVAISSSYALSSSYAVSASNAISASYVLSSSYSVSSSNALTASYIDPSGLTGIFYAQGGNSFSALAVLGTNDNNGLAIETNNIERARFDTLGNFGVGTNNPTYKVDVGGSIRAQMTGSVIAGFITTDGTYNGSSVYSIKPVGLGVQNSGMASSTGAIRIKMPTGNNTTMIKYVIDIYYYAGQGATYEIGGYDNGSWVGAYAYVTSGESTYYNLPVRLGYDASNNAVIFIGDTTTSWGSYSPSVVIREIEATGWSGNQANLANYRNTSLYNFSMVSSFTGDTISQTITNPTLAVRFTGVGGLNSGSLLFGSTAGTITQDNTNLFWDNTNKRLGIGTVVPEFRLDVSGQGRYTSGLIITGSLVAPSITGSLFGTSSWAQNSITSSYSLTSSLAISSSYALSSSYSVSSSVSVSSSFAISSSYALSSSNAQTSSLTFNAITASHALTASFVNPLRQAVIVTGSIILSGSMTVNTNGESRVFASTFRPAGSAGQNIFIGHAGTSNNGSGINSSYNTSVGVQALDNNTTGYINTAIGYGALDFNQTGYENTAIGYISLQSITTGRNNAALGSQALYLAAGDQNTAIGSNAGANVNGFVTSSIYIGYNSSTGNPGLSSQTNNEIVIGANTTGNGSNTVTIGSATITNTYLRGIVSASSYVGNGETLSNIVTRIIAGNNVTISPTSGTGSVTINASAGFPFTGSAVITGSLVVTGSIIATQGITGSLFGTSSWAQNALTASFITASNVFGPHGSNSVLSSSFAISSSRAVSSSLAQTASFTVSSSYSLSSSFALTSSFTLSSSYALSASYVFNAVTASHALTASSADNFLVRQNITASNALITGTITAQTLVVSTVSSSVVYSSGSNIFGNQLTNVQQFTGSLRVTGSGNHWIVGGNVGIGTTTPGATLDVNGRIRLTTNGSTEIYSTGDRVVFRAESTDNSAQVANYGMFLPQPNQAYNLYLAGSANLGYIDTNAKLDITSGSSGAAVFVRLNVNGNSFLNGGNVGIGTTNPLTKFVVSNAGSQSLEMGWSSGLSANFIESFNRNTSQPEDLSFYISGNKSIRFYTNASERVIISGSGNVGIGTTSPTIGKLQIDTISANNNALTFQTSIETSRTYGIGMTLGGGLNFYDNTAAASRLFISSSGNIGIGNTSPLYKLDITGQIGINSKLFLESSGVYNVIYDQSQNPVITLGNTSAPVNAYDNTTHAFRNRGGTTAYMQVGSTSVYISGSLGIGITTPNYKLSISGSNNSGIFLKQGNQIADSPSSTTFYNGLVFENISTTNAWSLGYSQGAAFSINYFDASSTYSRYVTIANNGNLGVGITSPSYKLDISGTARISSTVLLPGLSSQPFANVVTYDIATGQLYYTASSAIGGSGLSGGTTNYIPIWTSATSLSSSLLLQNTALKTVTAYGSIYAYTEQAGSGLNLFRAQNRDTTAGITHESRFGTQQLGAGAARTLFYAASPNTVDNSGELAILSENGGQLISTIGKYTTGVNNTLSVYASGSGNIETVRFHTAGNSFINGGSLGIGNTTPQSLLDVWNGVNSGIVASFGSQIGNNQFSGISFGYVESGNLSFRKSALVFERSGSNAEGKIHFLLNNNGSTSATAITDAVFTINSVGTTAGTARVGIGTRFPTASLHISGTVSTDNLMRVQSTAGSEYFFIGSNGRVGIGTNTPESQLHISSTGTSALTIGQTGASAKQTLLYHYTTGNGYFYMQSVFQGTAYTPIAMNPDGGNVGVGTLSPAYKLDISGSTRITGSLAVGNIAPSATVGRIDASNDVVAFSTSDMRFKTNLTPIPNALDKITQISGYEFDWIPNQEYHGYEGHDIGVIAQEIEQVLPEVVKERDSGYKAVKYEKIVPLLIEAIKEQQKQIDDLRYLLQNKT